MAKSKGSTSELERKLKAADELFDSTEAIITKYKNVPRIEKEDARELKKQTESLKKLKETLGQEAPIDTKKKIDQAIEKLKSILKEKKRPTTVTDDEKEETIELFNGVMESLREKLKEVQGQLEGQSKKKAKNQNKSLEKSSENLNYHIERLNEIRQQYETERLVEQDSTLKEILGYFQDYLDNAEYQQQKQTDYIDGLYESFFEKQEEEEESDSSFNNETNEADPIIPKETIKEEEIKGGVIEAPSGLDASEKKSFMERIRQNKFEHEAKKIPKISENDIKGEFNFFEMFEASFKNIPHECDVYPNSITKEKISTKNIYPKRRIVGEHMFERFDVDTLFFIFYFQKDTYEQYLAATELKKRAWRFHKKYLTWFKRLEAPRVINDEYEQGTYAFFDFEPGGWCQRRKSDFTFKYSYLEDEK